MVQVKEMNTINNRTMNIINCIYCGRGTTHQHMVVVYNREEDNETSSKVTIHQKDSSHVEEGEIVDLSDVSCRYGVCDSKENPSPRRQGVTIVMECESCKHHTKLNVYQHEGVTHTSITK